jgi:hypothetical protein
MHDEAVDTAARDRAFYAEVPAALSHAVAIGGALITMVEPHLGHERGYNRWYEDDHFYAGAMCMPWIMAGRRYVATRELQGLRYPADSYIAQPVSAGCYIHLYWITVEHLEDHLAWTQSTNEQLTAQGRRFEERTHIFTEFQVYAGAVYASADGPRDIHSLDYPYPGIVLEVLHADRRRGRPALDDWVREDYLPSIVSAEDAGVAQSLRFVARNGTPGAATGEPEDVPVAPWQSMSPTRGFAIPGAGRRITIVHFVEHDPARVWQSFADHGERVAASGLGRLELCAPFIPVLHGTDTYVDQLR